MGKLKFYRCSECGNLLLVLVDPSVKPVCCGNEMSEEKTNQTSADNVNHVPVIELDGDRATVSVSTEAHPMMAEHRIEWIILIDGPSVDIQRLPLTGTAVANFVLSNHGTERLSAYAFCNLHGLWESEE